MQWKVLHSISGTPPSKRYGHTATKWNSSIIVFGGCTENQEYCNDVHIFDSKTLTWHQPSISGSLSARYLHSATIYKDKLYIYGGFAKTSECTFVLDEMSILDLKSMSWTSIHNMPPRYNHSATLVGNKMYIYAGKDEQGTTVSDLFMIHLQKECYTPHLVIGNNMCSNPNMVLAKSQHFCQEICGKLLVFGRYTNVKSISDINEPDLTYSLWMLDLDTLEWERQECSGYFEVGGWNYFSVIREKVADSTELFEPQFFCNSLLFLGNTDTYRLQGHDHFRDALVISSESIGLYDIGASKHPTTEFAQLLNNPDLSDFSVVTEDGLEIYVHQIILLTRWPYFKNMYKSGMFESIAKKITIPEPYDVVMAFLKYIYTDSLEATEPWNIVCELLTLSDLYLINRLKKLCCERLYKRHMSVESCGYIFEKAIMTEETGLKVLALEFMFQNYGSFLKTNIFTTLPVLVQEEFLKAVPDEAVLRVGKSRLDSIKQKSTYSQPNRYNITEGRSRNNHRRGNSGMERNRNMNFDRTIEYLDNTVQNTQAELILIENSSDVTVSV
ncbi:hypothetical protein BY458DRAFT_483136 [Sporodiniella umbellata]|nr:hypothetical protein BY458DRAFT_483136 [Sporodiniella umbellata]